MLAPLRRLFDREPTRRALRWLFFACAAFALVMALLPHPPELPGEPGDKIQHMLAFVTLGALAAGGWRTHSAFAIIAALAGFGALIEVAQAIPDLHRDAQWSDWFADLAATTFAVGLVRAVLPRA